MTSGNSIYGKIKYKITDVDGEVNGLNSDYKLTRERISALEADRDGQYVKLAEFYLPALDADKIKATLVEVRSEVQSLFEARQERRKRLDQSIESSNNNRTNLQEVMSSVVSDLDKKQAEIDSAGSGIENALKEDSTYQDLNKTAGALEVSLEREGAAAQKFEDSAKSKRGGYEKNRLFKYLVNRKFGTNEFTGGKITARLDSSIVAEVVEFSKYGGDYNILVDMPQHITEYLRGKRQERDGIAAQMHKIEEGYAEKNNLPNLMQTREKTLGKRKELQITIEAEDRKYSGYVQERESLDGRKNDSYYQQASDKVKSLLERNDISGLKRKARETRSSEDDGIVEKIEIADSEIERLNESLQSLQQKREILSSKLGTLKEVERHFTGNDYEGSRSRFSSSFDIDSLLTGLLSGRYSLQKVKSDMDSSQHFEKPASTYTPSTYTPSTYKPSTPSFGGGFGGGSRSTGGGISTSGRSTGGGF